MRSANVFTAHAPPGAPADPAAQAAALCVLPAGFSWAALLFGPFWLAAKGLWLRAAALAAVYAGLGLAASAGYLSAAAELAVSLLVALFVALEGREWARRRLQRRGMPIGDIVVAASETEAAARVLRRLAPREAGGAA